MVIVLHDCKFGMAESDIQRIMDWLVRVSKPIVDKKEKEDLISKMPV